MPSLRPVAAVRTGSNSAASMNTSRVASEQPVLSPPMTPPRLTGPLLSAITVISPSSSYSRPSSALSVSWRRAPRSARSPSSFAASKTWSGRHRSKVRKLVISTNAEIGRKPIAASRSCSHRGDGPFLTPRTSRPRNSGQALSSGPARCTAMGEGNAPGTGSMCSGFSVPRSAAARSRAMPRTPRQSARLAVILMSSTGSSSPIADAKLSPTVRPAGNSMMPS